jgi:4-carboxymuconolactone decarboxylase
MTAHEPSAARRALGGLADKLADLTDDVLFGDVWERPELSPRDRSLITITALVVGGNTEQLPFHLTLGHRNGLGEDEIVEAITHLAFYTGWPRAMSAITAARQTFAAPADSETQYEGFPSGAPLVRDSLSRGVGR